MKINFICFLLFCSSFVFAQKHVEVFFDFNKDVPNEQSAIDLTAFLASKNMFEVIAITGYCDSIDDNLYNKELAMRRINSVLELLKRNAIPISKKLIVNAIGEDFKQSKNQAENRKVSIDFLEKVSAEKSEAKKVPEKNDLLDDKIEIERVSLVNKFEKAKIGDRIAIYNIHFKFNSENVETISEPLIEELLFIMEQNPKMVIKIHGHICCNPNPYNTKLSYRRALQLFNYLRENGIQQNRLAYNGVGSNNPIYPIPEKNEEERIANRRVEIEIIRK